MLRQVKTQILKFSKCKRLLLWVFLVPTAILLAMLLELASKNSNATGESARQLHVRDLSIIPVAFSASQEDLRPLLMTVISSIVGILFK